MCVGGGCLTQHTVCDALCVQLIAHLAKPGIQGWPVQLTKPVNVKEAEAKAAPKPAKKNAAAKKKPAAKKSSGKPVWLHGSLSKEEANGMRVL